MGEISLDIIGTRAEVHTFVGDLWNDHPRNICCLRHGDNAHASQDEHGFAATGPNADGCPDVAQH